MQTSPTTQVKLGLRIKDLREERGLSQYACAPLLKVSRTYLADLECGRRNVSLARLASIAEGFGITLEELFKGL
ncbi:helix-turn-helix domain-containing protein [Eggerthella sp. YY7918]|uniref:helix-turn-helix domain-containing protein n=1 Tax=Eggerthella sp. (strain YY7918) TaxID=502558 RepID=UPI000217129F|nr:helix-turn-helix transcriptional regulator [Eggerthella sp. YY7918]BAK45835.1 predicted transcriptional regulator [Eggerthella sp. YY7918]